MKAVLIAMLLLTAGSVVLVATPTASACSSDDPVGCVRNLWDTVDRTVDGALDTVDCRVLGNC